MVECLPSMRETLGPILSARKQKEKEVLGEFSRRKENLPESISYHFPMHISFLADGVGSDTCTGKNPGSNQETEGEQTALNILN